MNRAQRRSAQFKRAQRHDRNAMVEPSSVLAPVLRSRPFDAEEAARLSTEVRLAWHHLTHGDGTEHHFDTVAAALNVAAVMAADIDALLLDLVDRAQHAMAAMQIRYRRLGIFGADAGTLATVPAALEAYDELLRNATPLQMTAALKTSMRMVAQRQVIQADGAADYHHTQAKRAAT